MSRHRKNTVAIWLMSVWLMVLAGCGGGGDGKQPAGTTASPGNASPTAGGDKDPSLQKPASDPLHPVVLIETSLGNVTVKLDVEKAPLTVDNFLSYVGAGHYDQTIVHQVYKGQGFLAGGYGANLAEKRGRTPIFNEARNGVKNRRGTISMVRLPDAKDSATCQFFINVADNPALDHKDDTPEGYGYCVFGEVVEGLDVVDKIGNVPVHDTAELERTPVQAIVVKSIRRTR
jgi:cyclophilin family peptidyl-prolyl cis-trans isomerase